MSNYKLIAFDMDGTLLNSEKKIDKETLEAIHRAKESGKIIVLSTGRGPAELTDYDGQLVDLRYFNCISGAMIYDQQHKKAIYSNPMGVDVVEKLMEISEMEDIMVHFLCEDSIVARPCWEEIEKYHMGVYKPMYERCCHMVDNAVDWALAHPRAFEKINFYHTDEAARERTKARVLASGIPVEIAYAESTSLEFSAKGVDKGTGLLRLCEMLGISIGETIMVGDSDNDIAGLRAAGLAVGMGNSKESIAPYVDVYVADNDHGGCVEAIEKYLLA